MNLQNEARFQNLTHLLSIQQCIGRKNKSQDFFISFETVLALRLELAGFAVRNQLSF